MHANAVPRETAMIDAVKRAVESWNRGDLTSYLALYDPAIEMHGSPFAIQGIQALREFYDTFWAAFPGSTIEIEDTIASGDRLACRFSVHGVHSGMFQGLPPTGRSFVLRGITIFRFEGDRCRERWNQADLAGLMAHLSR